ncbi:MAG TPA: hypothetical protein VNF70_02175 [Pyrinomonadaceae bacterium]|nr:hypothetical protein [Pyrinomonadaceae bacterium]
MGQERSGISLMPQIFVHAAADKSMVISNKNRSGEIFAETTDGRPANGYSGNQEYKAQRPDRIRSAMDPTDRSEAKNHSDGFDEVGDVPGLRRI